MRQIELERVEVELATGEAGYALRYLSDRRRLEVEFPSGIKRMVLLPTPKAQVAVSGYQLLLLPQLIDARLSDTVSFRKISP